MDKSIFNGNKIHINRLLTPYRKKLVGRINAIKQQHNPKFLWTANPKILVWETETSCIVSFSTHEEFENHLELRLITDEYFTGTVLVTVICTYIYTDSQVSCVTTLIIWNLERAKRTWRIFVFSAQQASWKTFLNALKAYKSLKAGRLLSKFVAFAMNLPKKCKLFIKESAKGI